MHEVDVQIQRTQIYDFLNACSSMILRVANTKTPNLSLSPEVKTILVSSQSEQGHYVLIIRNTNY